MRVANQQYFAFLEPESAAIIWPATACKSKSSRKTPTISRISASGKMVVYKLLPNDKEEKVFEEAIKTDEKGRATWTWPTDDAGQFRIAYEAD